MKPIYTFLSRLFLIGIIYLLCRILFLTLNSNYYQELSLLEFLQIFTAGFRFDLSSIITINAPFILIFFIDIALNKSYIFHYSIRILFYIFNSFFILLNWIDSFWFNYTNKRSGINLFYLNKTGDSASSLIANALSQYWWALLIYILFIASWIYIDAKFKTIPDEKTPWIYRMITIISMAILSVIGIRGGLQLRPISMTNSNIGNHPYNSQLVVNTPFCLFQNITLPTVEEVNYMESTKVKNILDSNTPINYQFINSNNKKPNYILIIVESLSAEYCGFLNQGKGYTPFLDSLANYSIVFEQFYANGKQSIEGIPAILSGLPALMDEPFITSSYAGNRSISIASELKKYGYNSSFFHAGKNGTMNFDLYTKSAGFDQYFGKNEYIGNLDDDDKHWGIFDEPYGRYFADKISKLSQPYLSVWFTLSSHQPYILPSAFQNRFNKGTNPIHQSIGYTDYALRQLFAELKRKNLLESNTYIFITADHTGPSNTNRYNGRKNQYHIPLLIYHTGLPFKPQRIARTGQQTDIMDMILYPHQQSQNIWSSKAGKHYATNYINHSWQLINDSVSIEFNGNNIYYSETPKNYTPNHEEELLKAIIQRYNFGMIHNQLYNGK